MGTLENSAARSSPASVATRTGPPSRERSSLRTNRTSGVARSRAPRAALTPSHQQAHVPWRHCQNIQKRRAFSCARLAQYGCLLPRPPIATREFVPPRPPMPSVRTRWLTVVQNREVVRRQSPTSHPSTAAIQRYPQQPKRPHDGARAK
jgi:hypothetical protein